MTKLNALARQIHAVAVDKGHWPEHENMAAGEEISDIPLPPPERNFYEVLCLIHTEVSEAVEAYRDCFEDNPVTHWYYGPARKPEGVPSELVDILFRVLDIVGAWEIDIDAVADAKMTYNKSRSRLHGRAR